MTIAAGDTGLVHTALNERSVFIDLAVYLPVDMVESWVQQRRQIVLHKRLTHSVAFEQLRTPCMAGGANLDFDFRGSWCAAYRLSGLGVMVPSDSMALVKLMSEAFGRIIKRLPTLFFGGPCDMV